MCSRNRRSRAHRQERPAQRRRSPWLQWRWGESTLTGRRRRPCCSRTGGRRRHQAASSPCCLVGRASGQNVVGVPCPVGHATRRRRVPGHRQPPRARCTTSLCPSATSHPGVGVQCLAAARGNALEAARGNASKVRLLLWWFDAVPDIAVRSHSKCTRLTLDHIMATSPDEFVADLLYSAHMHPFEGDDDETTPLKKARLNVCKPAQKENQHELSAQVGQQIISSKHPVDPVGCAIQSGDSVGIEGIGATAVPECSPEKSSFSCQIKQKQGDGRRKYLA